MRIAIIGDTHLGFKFKEERGEDSFRNAAEAFQKAIIEKPDIIIQTGDMFHDKIPRPEIMSKSMELFSAVKNNLKSEVKIINRIKNKREDLLNIKVPPVFCIYGTHERRHAESVNPVQILEKAGFLTYLYMESILVETKNGKVGLHGLSGVPEQFAKDILKDWNPKPFPNVLNVFIIHQDFLDLIPQINKDVLTFADLPSGFDIYVLGHVHWRVENKHPFTNAMIIIPGSTIRTQLNKIESKTNKGIYFINSTDNKCNIKFVSLEKTRKFYMEEISVENKKPSEITQRIYDKIIKRIKYHSKDLKPILRFKLKGSLLREFLPTDLNFNSLIRKFQEKAIIYIDKSSVKSPKLSERAKLLADLKQKKISIDQLGINFLCKKMEKFDYNKIHSLFSMLVNGDLSKAEEVLNDQLNQS